MSELTPHEEAANSAVKNAAAKIKEAIEILDKASNDAWASRAPRKIAIYLRDLSDGLEKSDVIKMASL